MALGTKAPVKLRVRKRTLLAATMDATFTLTGTLASPLVAPVFLASTMRADFSLLGTLMNPPTWGVVSAGFYAGIAGTSTVLPANNATSVTFAPGSATAAWLSIVGTTGNFQLAANGTQTVGTLSGVILRATNSAGTADSAAFTITIATAIVENPAPAATGSYADVWNMWVNADISGSHISLGDVVASWSVGQNFAGSAPQTGIYGTVDGIAYRVNVGGSANPAQPDGWALSIPKIMAPTTGLTLFTPLCGGYGRIIPDELAGNEFHIVPG